MTPPPPRDPAPSAPDAQAPPAPDGAGLLPLFGPETSRYAPESSLWQVLERARSPTGQRVPGFHFVWGDPVYHAEGAVAMGVAVVAGVVLAADEMHRKLCRGQRPCSLAELTKAAPGLPYRMELLRLTAPAPDRATALAACSSSSRSSMVALAYLSIEGKAALALPIYAPGAFEDDPSGRPSDAHLFVVAGVGLGDELLLRDAADRYPVTYRLPNDRFCDAVVAPLDHRYGTDQRDYREWAVWALVMRPSGPPPVVALPGPIPQLPELTPWTGGDLLPAVVLPGRVGDDPFDLGVFVLPAELDTATQRDLATGALAPEALRLRAGVSDAARAAHGQWLSALEMTWGVERISDTAFRSRRPQPTDDSNPLVAAIRRAAVEDGPELARLAALFRAAQSAHGQDERWFVERIVRFVQAAIPYELIEEDPMGFRPPVGVLAAWLGDCDSKSALAAALLRVAGIDSAVVLNFAEHHAVLGIGAPFGSDDGVSVQSEDGRSYVMAEMTTVRPIGDMRGIVRTPSDPRASGWVAIPLAQPEGGR